MRLVAEMAIWLALLMACWAVTVYAIGAVRLRSDLIASGDRAVHAMLALTGIAAAGLMAGLVGRDFTVRYVAVYTSVNLPSPYSVAAFWSGAHGSLLFVIVALGVATSVILFTSPLERRIEVLLLTLVLAVLLASLCIALNPLSKLDWEPADGIGMHPLLQSPGASVFPPLLYTAYACYAVPAVMVIAGILRRKIDVGTVAAITEWVTIAWLINTLGVVAGIWWAYHEPSRMARWPLFPLESGALLPWISGSCFLAAAVVQERRGHIAAWSLALVVAAFLLSIPAGVLTVPAALLRPGEVARSPFFMAACIAVVAGILVTATLVSSRFPGTETVRRPVRVYALAVSGVALAMILAALAGYRLRTEREVELSASRPIVVTDRSGVRWTIGSQGVSSYNELNRRVAALAVDIQRNERHLGLLSTETRQYVDMQGAPVFQPSHEPGIRSSIREDMYIVLGEISADGSADLRVAFNPLMIWLWIGGILLAIGGLMVTWPSRGTAEAG